MVTSHRKGPLLESWDLCKSVNNAYDAEINLARETGVPIVVHTSMVAPELLAAFDVIPIGGEWYGSIEGFMQDISLLETSEQCGFPHEVCSYSRMCLGSMIADRGFLGPFPKPRVVIGQDGMCTMQAKWFEKHACYLNVPYFVIDVPSLHLHWDEEAIKDAQKYMVCQMHSYIDFMESALGQKLEEERMIDTVVTSHCNRELWSDVMELWRAVPSPISIRSLFTYENIINSLGCRREATRVLRALVEELKQRVNDGVSGIGVEEMRLLWSAQPAWYMLPVLRYFESVGASFSTSTYLDAWGSRTRRIVVPAGDGPVGNWLRAWEEPTNLEECLEQIAKDILTHHIRPRVDVQVKAVIELARLADVDAVVYHLVRGCKGVSYGQLVEREAVRGQLGIPCLLLEGSPADPRDYSATAGMRQIRIFLEQIRDQKERRASV